jgi:hypothetical protein
MLTAVDVDRAELPTERSPDADGQLEVKPPPASCVRCAQVALNTAERADRDD